jgi:hypothetical protein
MAISDNHPSRVSKDLESRPKRIRAGNDLAAPPPFSFRDYTSAADFDSSRRFIDAIDLKHHRRRSRHSGGFPD